MAHRGRCRCGTVLRFEQGPHGYKTICPSCNSVVRLCLQGPWRQKVVCRCGAKVKLQRGESRPCPQCHQALALPEALPPIRHALAEAVAPTLALEALEALRLEHPLTGAIAANDNVVSAAAIAPKSRIVRAASDDAPSALRMCQYCGVSIPAGRPHCPVCDTRKTGLAALADDVFLEACPEEEPSPRRRQPRQPWLIGTAIVVGVCVLVLLGMLWRWGHGSR